MSLVFQGRVWSGESALDGGISDLQIIGGPGGPILVTSSRGEGGLVSYALSAGTLPTLADIQMIDTNIHTTRGPTLSVQGGRIVATGFETGEVRFFDLHNNGSLQNQQINTLGIGDWAHLEATQDGRLIVAEGDNRFVEIYALDTDQDWTLQHQRSDTQSSYARDIGATVTAQVGDTTFVVVGGTLEVGLTTYEVRSSSLRTRSSVDPSDGIGLMQPTDLATVTLDGTTYILAASAPSAGQSGAITVLTLEENGAITPVDHILDTLNSRFGQIQALSVVAHDGIGLVTAGGGDDGLSLLALLPGGRLVHLGALPNSIAGGLDGVTEIESIVQGETLHVYVASGDMGVAALTYDLSNFGDVRAAAQGGAEVSGTAQDNILSDGNGTDTLFGGSGSDVYVLEADGVVDHIFGFDPADDRIDLSSWPFLYDVASLTISQTSDGARISHLDEVLTLTSHNGQPLELVQLKSRIMLDATRSFHAPSLNESRGAGDDTLTGTWGSDTLSSGAGDDWIDGGSGDDLLDAGTGHNTVDGGSGTDTLNFAYATTDIVSVTDHLDGAIILTTASGSDTVAQVEQFAFTDHTLSAAEVAALFDAVILTGTDGHDTLSETTKPAEIYGGDGSDTLLAGIHDDTLFGGEGHDRLVGGGGSDTLYGGSGTDRAVLDYALGALENLSFDGTSYILLTSEGTTFVSAIETFQFADIALSEASIFKEIETTVIVGTANADSLSATFSTAELHGQDGDDRLEAGRGDDHLFGGAGDDSLIGGAGDDVLSGGSGDNRIDGGDGDDTLLFDHDSTALSGIRLGDGAITLSGADGSDIVSSVEYFAFNDETLNTADLVERFSPVLIEGGSGNDVLIATNAASALFGYGGNDELRGGWSGDTLSGGSGNDELRGYQGNDWVEAGDGDDQVWTHSGDDFIFGGAGRDTLRGSTGEDMIYGGDGNDRISGQRHNDTLYGDKGDDQVITGGGNDVGFGGNGHDFLKGGTYHDDLSGGAGDDVIFANRGNDTLDGGAGADELRGGGGSDTLTGGSGDDLLIGGRNADEFIFDIGHGDDIIEGFSVTEDRLSLSADLVGGLTDGSQVVDTFSILTEEGAVLDFGDNGTILLKDVRSLSGLGTAVDVD
ncbi:MAG: calcium-binding protein [Pseudomonadota bacterium]